VNLTRFPLFVPEKRGFFLDGATFYDFPERAFFSRRIGLDANGQPQRIDAGAKLTGQIGRYDVGLLYARTGDEAHTVLGEDALVARVRRRVLRQSYVGAIFTSRATRDQTVVPTRTTAGADFRLSTSSFLDDKNLDVTGYFMRNSTTGGVGDAASWALGANYPNDAWEMSVEFQEVQKNFNPALGFTERRDIRRYTPEFTWNPRPKNHPWIRQFGFGVDASLYTDTENRAVTREVEIQALRVAMHSGDNVEFSVTPSYERLEEDFEISEGVNLPIGSEYTFTRYSISANTANKRIVSFQPSIEWGGFLSGHRTEVSTGIGVRPRPGVTMSLSYEWNTVDLPEGHFQTSLYRLVADTQFSPFIYLVNNVQYDSVSRVLGWQSRFRWILTPGSDLFIVYTQNWLDRLDPSSRFLTLDRRGATKAVYTKRF
jgi:hypothetical protein